MRRPLGPQGATVADTVTPLGEGQVRRARKELSDLHLSHAR